MWCLRAVLAALIFTHGQVLHLTTANVIYKTALGPDGVVMGSGEGEIPITHIGLPDTCTEMYQKIPGHTMCMEDSWKVVRSGVSPEEKQLIVNYHNQKRGTVNPPATDMALVAWDDALAAVAEKWARQCEGGHDKERDVPLYGMACGQNVARGQLDWAQALNDWHSEVSLYRYGKAVESYLGPGGFKHIGHYTALVQSNLVRVGCGFADCASTQYGRHYVCNYLPAQTNVTFPYTRGPRCEACPNTCRDGLCDCGGKVCFNRGKLDKNTCTCKCQQGYIRDDCREFACPKEDPFYCGTHYKPSFCKKYVNVPAACPYMCSLCVRNQSTSGQVLAAPPLPEQYTRRQTSLASTANQIKPTGSTNQNVGNNGQQRFEVVNNKCVFKGTKPSKEECRKLGIQGQDLPMCLPHTCESCNQAAQQIPHTCPVLCGLCDAPSAAGIPIMRRTPDSRSLLEERTTAPIGSTTTNIPIARQMCPYDGPLLSRAHCNYYPVDLPECMSRGGLAACYFCDLFTTIRLQRCPIMCGRCEPPCDGKVCINEGELDASSCTCSCKLNYSGDHCEIYVCPQTDSIVCTMYLRSYCGKHPAVIRDCPYLCGIC